MSVAEPELTVVRPDGPARPGRPYRFACEVSWTGAPSAYTVLPARLGAVDWCEAAVVASMAFVRGGVHVVAQTIEIIPAGPGEFESPAIRIPYLLPEATPPTESAGKETLSPRSSVPPPLVVDVFPLAVRPDRTPVWISGGLGVSLFFLALGWWFARRRPGERHAIAVHEEERPV